MQIDYDNPKLVSMNKWFYGTCQVNDKEYKFTINAHWNDWDDWSVDGIDWDEVPDGSEELEATIIDDFLNDL